MYLYTMGRGHSGSTLLDSLLGNSHVIESVGEVVSGLSRADRELCACGTTVTTCPFWNEVRASVETQDIAWEDLIQLSLSQINLSHLWWTWRAAPEDPDLSRLEAATTALRHAITSVSGKPHLLDSNKAVPRALFLLRRYQDARVIHLIRDPRGVLRSHHWRLHKGQVFKFQRREYRAGPATPLLLLLAAVSWTLGNLLAELVARSAPGRVVRVRYEDLYSNPAAEVKRIGSALGLDLADVASKLAAGATFSVGHNVGGNQIRHAGRVQLDPSYASRRPSSPSWLSLTVLACCWPLMQRYGYSLRGVVARSA
jgi:Sulfotransferase family